MNGIIDFTFFETTFLHLYGYISDTLILTILSMIIGTVLGLISALSQILKIPVLKQLSIIFVLICRSVPNMILLYLIYYAIPLIFLALQDKTGISIPFAQVSAFTIAIIALGMHIGAYLSEAFRAAILSVPKGQMEAALSVGMTWSQGFRKVVLPQAIVFALPLFANNFLDLMKSTSIVFVITVVELFGAAKMYSADNYQYFETFIVVACIYWIMSGIFELIFSKSEFYLSKYKRGNNHD